MSKKVKSVVGIAAAIAIPYASPVIASTIGLTEAIGSSMIASGLTGAALGAATGELTGGDAFVGALAGGVGGAISGANYNGGGLFGGSGTTGSTGVAGANTAGTTAGATTGASTGYESALMTGASPSTTSAATSGATLGASGSSLGSWGIPSEYAATMNMSDPSSYALSGLGSSSSSGSALANLGASTGSTLQSAANNIGTAALQQPASSGLSSWWDGLSDAAKQGLIRTGGQLLGQAVAGNNLGAVVDKQADYLKDISDMQRDSYNRRVAAANTLMGEAAYYDPSYFGTEAHNNALISGTAAKNAALREMSGTGRTYASDAEARRYNLGTALNAASQYTQAADAAQNQRVRTYTAGAQLLPQGVSDYSGSYGGLYNTAYDYGGNLADTFGSLFGSIYSKSGDSDKAKDATSLYRI